MDEVSQTWLSLCIGGLQLQLQLQSQSQSQSQLQLL